jgi:NADPH-dependent 2,4-dienoyl-CoA reductase/sulfur reductase-like enzyme
MPVRAPALHPVSVYRVERQDGRVFVREKVDPPAPPRVEGGPASVVIVGAGAAGNAVALTLRREGYKGRILLLGPEPDAPYDRPNLSKDYLAGNAPEEWIPLHPPEHFEENRIELRLGARAESIDPNSQTVRLSDGETLRYGALVLATGAEPIRLNLPGADLPQVHYLRSLQDSRDLIAAAGKGRRAVVIGASFIGLEVAASLRAREIDVTVVAPDERPLGKILGPELGDFIRGLHEEKGVVFELGTKPKAFRAGVASAVEVELENGKILPADLVVVGIGVRPRLALAEALKLEIDNGILVDEHLQTSTPGIWAVGDIARWPDPHSGERIRVEHWVVAERQGQSVACNLLGDRKPFDAVPFFWSQHYDVSINYVGHASSWDAIEVRGSIQDRDPTVTYRSNGRAAAVATVYRDKDSLEAELAMERG